MRFVDDRGIPVMTVTVEQHALDNPQHHVRTWYEQGWLHMRCDTCAWFDDQGYSGVQKPPAHRAKDMDAILEQLYDFSHKELRQLALECLLITDGPNKVLECPHCGSHNIDRGATGLDECNECGGLSRRGQKLRRETNV